MTARAHDGFGQWTDDQKEEFLRTAEVASLERLKIGVTRSQRATLSSQAVTHDAHFQSIDEFKPVFQGVNGSEPNFTDSYKYNIAAYRLDRMIGLNLVPVSIERKIRGTTGALTWWIDNVKMMELERYKKGITPPNQEDWNDQMYNIRVFNELVYNIDPNLGNVLITNDWLPRPVDFTRAFRRYRQLRAPKNLARVDARVYEGLKRLTQPLLEAELGDYLPPGAIRGLLGRRDRILHEFDLKIAELGEAAVVCKRPEH